MLCCGDVCVCSHVATFSSCGIENGHWLKPIGIDTFPFFYFSCFSWITLLCPHRDYFIRNLHDALSGYHSQSVEESIRYSEQAVTKCVGITIETRPDYCLKPHLEEMLSYGCTRIEIGVQSVYESVARETNRGHTVAAVSHSFHLAKDCGFKVVTHMMPDLPNMGFERDLEGFRGAWGKKCFWGVLPSLHVISACLPGCLTRSHQSILRTRVL